MRNHSRSNQIRMPVSGRIQVEVTKNVQISWSDRQDTFIQKELQSNRTTIRSLKHVEKEWRQNILDTGTSNLRWWRHLQTEFVRLWLGVRVAVSRSHPFIYPAQMQAGLSCRSWHLTPFQNCQITKFIRKINRLQHTSGWEKWPRFIIYNEAGIKAAIALFRHHF